MAEGRRLTRSPRRCRRECPRTPDRSESTDPGTASVCRWPKAVDSRDLRDHAVESALGLLTVRSPPPCEARARSHDLVGMPACTWTLRRLHALDDAQVEQLAAVTMDCVEGGASIGFMSPFPRERAVAFWRKVAQ